jgi:hypothetical protein
MTKLLGQVLLGGRATLLAGGNAYPLMPVLPHVAICHALSPVKGLSYEPRSKLHARPPPFLPCQVMTRSSLPPPSPVHCNDPPNAVALHSGGTSADNDEDNLQSRVARNAHTPFGQLPDDILIHIAKDACTDASALMGRSPRALEVMTMVHGRLRALLLRTAELWASVNFAWRIARLETYAARSLPACPLAVRFNLWSTKTEGCARLAQYLPYTRALTVLWDEQFEHLLFGRTDVADATLLETLTVSRFDRKQGPFRPDFLNHASWVATHIRVRHFFPDHAQSRLHHSGEDEVLYLYATQPLPA